MPRLTEPDTPQLVPARRAVPIDQDLDAWVRRLRRNVPTGTKRTSGRQTQATRVKPGLPPGQFLTEHGADLTARQIDFGKVMDRYKRDFRRPYPTYAQVLDVIDAMGYRLVAPAVAMPRSAMDAPELLRLGLKNLV